MIEHYTLIFVAQGVPPLPKSVKGILQLDSQWKKEYASGSSVTLVTHKHIPSSTAKSTYALKLIWTNLVGPFQFIGLA
jgi:hypothetical protein